MGAPLAPALQGALTAAMQSDQERVEILIDPSTRSWIQNISIVETVVKEQCCVYEAFPRDRRMGKVGGEPPRPVRWRAGAPMDLPLPPPDLQPASSPPDVPADVGPGDLLPE